jgi:hypothetical protein
MYRTYTVHHGRPFSSYPAQRPTIYSEQLTVWRRRRQPVNRYSSITMQTSMPPPSHSQWDQPSLDTKTEMAEAIHLGIRFDRASGER